MLKNKLMKKALLPTCITLVTLASFVLISSTGKQKLENNKVIVQSTNITISLLHKAR